MISFPRNASGYCVLTLIASAWNLTNLTHAQSAPEDLTGGIEIRSISEVQGTALRIDRDPVSGNLIYATITGDVYRVDAPFGQHGPVKVHSADDHGLTGSVQGMTIGPDGTLYLVGNETNSSDATTRGIILRGEPASGEERSWSTVARTVFYPASNSAYDHSFNGIVVSPDGQDLYVNSGSRTDHGEIQDAGGIHAGVREVALTSAIFRIPTDAQDLVLPNDLEVLQSNGWLYADGTRNSFDMAFDSQGRLFATENSGDRDDSEELNWIEQGAHYGFPWRMGLDDNPQQFPDYDPATDERLNPAAGAVQQGHFHNDPGFPEPPSGVLFTDPLLNVGPDADLIRDADTGDIIDAGLQGIPMGTFTSHRSPLGLVLDINHEMPPTIVGNGFVFGWTGSESLLLEPFEGEGEDLLMLDFNLDQDSPSVRVERMVRGFLNPIDAVQTDNRIYILEFGSGARIWELTFTSSVAVEPESPATPFQVDLYPNPSTGALRVDLQTDRPERIRIDVFSVIGRRVARVFDGMVAGQAHLGWDIDLDDQPSGTYLIRISGENRTETKRVVVLGRIR